MIQPSYILVLSNSGFVRRQLRDLFAAGRRADRSGPFADWARNDPWPSAD